MRHLYEMSGMGKSLEEDSSLLVVVGGSGGGRMCLHGSRVSFWDHEDADCGNVCTTL